MSQKDTPAFDPDEFQNDIQRHVEQSADKTITPAYCRLLLVVNNQAISSLLYDNDFIDLGRFPADKSPREVDLSLLIQKGDGVSRSHARLYFLKRAVFVSDLASTNGTYLNGNRVDLLKPMKVENGDILQLGKLKMIVNIGIFDIEDE